MPQPNTLAFDLFNTLINMEGSTEEERKAYADHLTRYYQTGVYYPWIAPDSWDNLKPFPEVSDALRVLVEKGFRLVTMSNADTSFQGAWILNNHLEFAFQTYGQCTNLDTPQVFKPSLRAYRYLQYSCNVPFDQIGMVSGNLYFGDLEAAERVNMTPIWINRHSHVAVHHARYKVYRDLMHLAQAITPVNAEG